MKPEEYKPLIKRILSEFDFEKVHDYMEQENWEWGRNDDLHVPGIIELYQRAEELLTEAAERGGVISIGGFIAYCNDLCLWLSFSIDDCGYALGDLEIEPKIEKEGGPDND